MASSQSFQLPDLLNIIGPLELRTNPHCRFATDASEKWVSIEIHALSENELTSLRAAKIGLLAGLCFPTCDPPQLRLLVDFMTLVFYSATTWKDDPDKRGWWKARAENADADTDDLKSGVDMLASHALLKHAIHSQVQKLSRHASESWKERFAQSVSSFRTAQEQLLLDLTPTVSNPISSVESYVDMRRELYGSSMTLDIAELLQIFQLPDLQPEGAAGAIVLAMAELQRAAFDVIAWSTVTTFLNPRTFVLLEAVADTYPSQDVVSYQRGRTANLVAVLVAHRGLSVQGAMNVCGNMIRGAFASFCDIEQRILDLLEHPHGTSSFQVLARVWKGSPLNAVSHDQEAAVKRYIKALKDCIVGTIHWIYETELFFGKKGSEIRSFGWIFVDQAHDDT